MKNKPILLGATTALLLASPAMGAITLTNGNFSTPDTSADVSGWKAGPSNATMFTIAGGVNGVANGPTGAGASLYQTFSDSAMSTVNISFDFILVAPGTGGTARQMDFRTLVGTTTANSTHARFIVAGDGTIDYLNTAGTAFIATTTTGTTFLANVADTYHIDLQFTGLDGAAGAMGTMNGTITRASDSASYGFSGTNLNWVAVDSMEFQNAANWGTAHDSDFDNVSVIPEPTAALLGSLGLLALLRRRRN